MSMTTVAPATLSTEQIEQYWQQTQHKKSTQNNCELAYMELVNQQSSALIVLLPGRVETYLKYKTLIATMAHHGYSVLAIDHRGQGLSQRELKDTHKGHISSFQLYAQDAHAILSNSQLFQASKQKLLLSHSMGGAIAVDLASHFDCQFDAIALNAPMLGINTNGIPKKLAWWLARIINISRYFLTEPAYFPGQGRYQPTAFADNELTHDQARFEQWQVMLQREALQLGGVTTQWLYESLNYIKQLPQTADAISSPILLLQAELESVVDNQGQDDWLAMRRAQQLPYKKVLMPNAKHEILMEVDEIRDEAISHILSFFQEHSIVKHNPVRT